MQGWKGDSFLQNTILCRSSINVMPETTIGGGDEWMRGLVSAKSTTQRAVHRRAAF